MSRRDKNEDKSRNENNKNKQATSLAFDKESNIYSDED